MIVRIWHNEDRDHFFGYEYGHRLTEVFAYSALPTPPDDDDETHCDIAYRLFNVGDDPAFGEPHPFAIAYRMAGHRSLSVGDVVEIDGPSEGVEWGAPRFYACAPSGWTRLRKREEATIPASVIG